MVENMKSDAAEYHPTHVASHQTANKQMLFGSHSTFINKRCDRAAQLTAEMKTICVH